MDSIPLGLQIAVAAVGIIGTGGSVTLAILSHRTASRALKLSEDNLRFAHEERTAALRNKLSERRTELYSEFSALAVRIANTITIVAQERRRLLGRQTTRSGENEVDWKSSDVYHRYRETVLDFNDCHQKMLIVATVGVLSATEDLRLELDRFEDIVLGQWPDVSEYPQFGKRASEALDVVSQKIEALTAEARSDLGTERLSEQLSKVLSERVMGIRGF